MYWQLAADTLAFALWTTMLAVACCMVVAALLTLFRVA
jgi:ABC-type Fe3+ transport system permease subunit